MPSCVRERRPAKTAQDRTT